MFNNVSDLKQYLKKYQLNNSIFIYKNKELKDLKFINDDYLVICDKVSNPVSVNNMFTYKLSFLNNNNIINNINNIDNNNDNNNSSINNRMTKITIHLENISSQFKFDKELEELKSGIYDTVLIKALLITEGNLEQSINIRKHLISYSRFMISIFINYLINR